MNKRVVPNESILVDVGGKQVINGDLAMQNPIVDPAMPLVDPGLSQIQEGATAKVEKRSQIESKSLPGRVLKALSP